MKLDVSDMTKVDRLRYIIFGVTRPMGEFGLARGASECQGLGSVAMLDARMPNLSLVHVDDQWRVSIRKRWNDGTRLVAIRIILCCIIITIISY
jgi:hypothetical protein